MNRKTFTSILALGTVCLAFGLLTGCSSSSKPAPTIAIAANTPYTTSATVGESFGTFAATVTSNGSPASGVSVVFTAPSSAPSGTFANGTNTETDTTNASGVATSSAFTADSSAGAYTVAATTTGASTPADFNLTNAAPSVFTFYVSGMEAANDGPNFYGIVGAVGFDTNGNVLGGEEDYNDGSTAFNFPDLAISATGSSMTVNSDTGTGTLVLAVPSATVLGNDGVETFAVQFINPSHALITQFDGSATSSGSMDLQSATTETNFAFTISGTDSSYNPAAYGGIFTVSSGAISGIADYSIDGVVATGTAGTPNMTGAVVTKPDAYGRGTATLTMPSDVTLTISYYDVTPEVLRLIDMDVVGTAGDGGPAIGSAYGQGATPAFDSTALGTNDVFGVQGGSWALSYAEAGSLATSGAAPGTATANFSGTEGDANWEGEVSTDATITAGTYTIAASGYGGATIEGLAGVALPYGLYATLSSVNLLDPNNTSGGGGALLLDLYPSLSGGTGVIVPQGATKSSDFNGLSYGFGAQELNDVSTLPSDTTGFGEFDYVAQGAWDTTLDLTGGGLINDPFAFFVSGTAGEYGTPSAPIPFAGTAGAPDSAGRYAFPLPGTAGNFAIGPVGTGGPTDDFTVVLYEANPALVFSIDEDTSTATPPAYSLWLGTFQEQSSGGGDAKHRKIVPASKATKKR